MSPNVMHLPGQIMGVCCRTPVHALGSHKDIVTVASSINPIVHVTPKGNEKLCIATVNSS